MRLRSALRFSVVSVTRATNVNPNPSAIIELCGTGTTSALMITIPSNVPRDAPGRITHMAWLSVGDEAALAVGSGG